MKWPNNKFVMRFTFYFLGLVMLTLGIALTILANLGASPFDALLVGLYNTFGLTVGSWEYILGAILLLINAVLQKRRPEILAMATAVITGLGIDFWLFILSLAPDPTMIWLQGVMLISGVIFVSLGIATYLQADFAPSPFDKTMLVLHQRWGISVSTAKNILMFIFLLLAVVFDGPIALGTIITVLTSGPIIGFFMPKLETMKSKLIEVALANNHNLNS